MLKAEFSKDPETPSNGISSKTNSTDPTPSTIPFSSSDSLIINTLPNPYLPSPDTHPEYQYLNLVRYVMNQGFKKTDRTGTGTFSVFAPPPLRFNLNENNIFPLLTTKRVFFRGVVEELLWFLRGDTDAIHLSSKGVKIWDGNGSLEFLKSVGLGHRREGDLGPVYGFQWRHFGAEYIDCETDYKGKGVDQLWDVINKIVNKPDDRRIIMSAWNPSALKEMALPPCHMFCQFYVSPPTSHHSNPTLPVLSCQLYQRSADLGLGVPFNIASYALLTRMIAHVTGCQPGEFIHVMGDCHIYSNHIEGLTEQLSRDVREFPILNIKKPFLDHNSDNNNGNTLLGSVTVDDMVSELENMTWDDFELIGYLPHGKVKMEMAV